jgi:group I intron endonuclease
MPGGTIYLIQNMENGKKYIGQTTRSDLSERFREHCGNSQTSICPKLRNAIKKYGKDCFIMEPLWTSDVCDQHELDNKEIELIEKYNTLNPNGYNLTIGGSGGRHSDETKRLISEKSKKAWELNGTRYRNERKQRGNTQESKLKVSATLKELFKNKPEIREKISKGNQGKKRSEESKQKYREASQLKLNNPEYIKKLKESASKRNKKVFAIDKDNKVISIYESLTQTPIQTGIPLSAIRRSISTGQFLTSGLRYSYSTETPAMTA